MRAIIPCHRKPFAVDFNIRSSVPQRLRILAYDTNDSATKYYDRFINMRNGPRSFRLNFPQSPEVMAIRIAPVDSGYAAYHNDRSLDITDIKYSYLITRNCRINSETDSFIAFAKSYAERAGNLAPGMYVSKDKKFRIVYKDHLRNKVTGQVLNTPAHIGHTTGIIGISRAKFKTYTVPVRLIILLHEYSHKYLNPKIKTAISNETGADLNALYIYLCMGYPTIDARLAFAYVFQGADNAGNQKRMAIIEDFITKFEQGKVK